MTPEAERFNGWAAMLGFVAAVGGNTQQQDKSSQASSNGKTEGNRREMERKTSNARSSCSSNI